MRLQIITLDKEITDSFTTKMLRLIFLVLVSLNLSWEVWAVSRVMWEPVVRNETSLLKTKHTSSMTTKTMRFKDIKAGKNLFFHI